MICSGTNPLRAPIPAGWSVIVGRKRVLHNLPNYLLSDIDGKPSKCSDSVTNITQQLKVNGFAVSSTALRNPLHVIVARTPVSVPIQGSYSTYYFIDTLACGHQVVGYRHVDDNKKRRGCQACGEAQLAIKFPPSSVPLPASPKKRRIA